MKIIVKMNGFSVSIILLVVSCSISNAFDPNGPLATASTEETTDLDEPINSEEAFDPQKEYAELNKLYKLSGPSLLPKYLQQQQARSWHFQSSIDDIDNDEMIASTINSNNRKIDNEDDEIINTTTFPPSIDAQSQHTTVMPVVNSLNQMESFDTIGTPQNAEMLAISAINFATTNLMGGNANANDEFGNHVPVDSGVQRAAVIFKNDANNNNNNNNYNNNNDYGNQDYVIENHDNHEVNNSQSITLPYSVDTTIASFPSSPIFIPTRPPTVLYTASSTSANAIATPSAFMSNDDSNGTFGQTNPTTSKKSAKKIEPRVYKYSADEIIRKYLDDTYIRAPMATLINTSPEPLRKAKMLWKSSLRPNTAIDIVLVAFNSSGVGVTYSFKNTRTMIAGLESVQESREMLEGGSGFYGILRASELVPYDSAIFISTDKIPQDISLMKNAATILLKKRIRLYLIWFGVQDIDENETSTGGVLGEVALRSGGEIFRITEESLGNGDVGLVTHFLQNDIQGAQVLDIPVNTTTTNLHIEIQGNVEQATLITPNGG